MKKNLKSLYIKIISVIAFISMVIVNALANILPINGINTGQVSDSYPNLFAPAGITFSIWGLIYLLLGIFVIYQFFITKKIKILDQIGIYFIITSIANILWIFSWHYDYIGLSVLLMLIILISLIKIANILNKENLILTKDFFLISLPFSIYFGWITVATIANITTFLVSLNWNAFGLTEQFWTIAIIIIGSIIGLLRMFKDKNIAYGLVFVWAYIGIWIKHISEVGFNNQYPAIIITTIICIILFLLSIGFILYKENISKNKKIN
jgi:hypothetical protein